MAKSMGLLYISWTGESVELGSQKKKKERIEVYTGTVDQACA